MCGTNVHIKDGELAVSQASIVPRHEIVGRIDALGAGVNILKSGDRIGVPWLGQTCSVCPFCRIHAENLCQQPLFSDYFCNGGFVPVVVADAQYARPLGRSVMMRRCCLCSALT